MYQICSVSGSQRQDAVRRHLSSSHLFHLWAPCESCTSPGMQVEGCFILGSTSSRPHSMPGNTDSWLTMPIIIIPSCCYIALSDCVCTYEPCSNRKCSCHRSLLACSFFPQILQHAFGKLYKKWLAAGLLAAGLSRHVMMISNGGHNSTRTISSVNIYLEDGISWYNIFKCIGQKQSNQDSLFFLSLVEVLWYVPA